MTVTCLLLTVECSEILISNLSSLQVHCTLITSWFWLTSSNLKSDNVGSVDVVIWRGGGVTAGFEIDEEEDEVKDYQDNSLSFVCGVIIINICHAVTLDSRLDSRLLK